jgi:hypothetical protein
MGFKANYDCAGTRGHAILVGLDSLNNIEITLQYRAVDPHDQLPLTDFPIATVVDVRIVFCPWCGRNAEEWYGKYASSLFRPGLKIH